MKIKSMLFVLCFGLCSMVMAAQQTAAKPVNYPGYCDIEIINDSYSNVLVFASFSDLTVRLDIPPRYRPEYINLYYRGYCYDSAYVTIESAYGVLYSGFTAVGSTLTVVPYLNNSLRVKSAIR